MATSMKAHVLIAVLGSFLLAPATVRAQDTVVYYHTDAIGSVRAITDSTGAEIARYDYLPFGELWPASPPAPADVRQFAGKERDSNTELDYFGARYLRAQSGRFTSVDPVLNVDAALIDPQQWNRYAYALNNPFVFIDPDGRDVRMVVNPMAMARAGAIRDWVAGAMGMNAPNPHPHAKVGASVLDSILGTFLPRTPREVADAGNAAILGMAGALETGGMKVVSAINRDKTLVRLAEDAGRSVQGSIDTLTKQLAQGNLNPGIGTKNLFGNVMYARARDGARVFFRQVGDTIEILAKGSKHNEDQVIRKLQELYR